MNSLWQFPGRQRNPDDINICILFTEHSFCLSESILLRCYVCVRLYLGPLMCVFCDLVTGGWWDGFIRLAIVFLFECERLNEVRR